MPRRTSLLVLFAALAVAVAGCGGGGPKTKADYVKANESLFHSLPSYPHAKVTGEGTSAYSSGTGSDVGYQTRFNVSLQGKASVDKLQSFYAGQLEHGWKLVAQLDGPVLNFRKGNAFISINLTGAGSHRLQVTVDQAFYKHAG
jgi:hypothetical protein